MSMLLWLDLEMTGLNHEDDFIVEAAAITTDWNLSEIARYESGVKNDDQDAVISQFKANDWFTSQSDDYQKQMMDISATGSPLAEVEQKLLAMLPEQGDVYLAGNSIHMDMAFVRGYWPRLAERLHYRLLDVSSFKLWMQEAKGIEPFVKGESHRALDDIKESIAELKYYDQLFK